jgi:FtsH-binding integral membrane protein
MVMFISAAYNPEIVLIAATFTATVAVALTIYAFTTKNDFTASGGALAIFLSVFLLLGVMLLFFNTPVAATCYSGIGVIVFGFYLIYDTQLVVGGG